MLGKPSGLQSVYPLASALAILFALAVCLVVLLFWILRKSRSAAQQSLSKKAPDSSKTLTPEQRPKTTEVDRVFKRNLARLRQLAAGRNYLYQIPWTLVIGTPEAGKTTALNNVGLRRILARDEATSFQARSGISWHFFNQGVAIDVPGKVLLGTEQPLHHHRWWRRLAWHLRTARSRRPLDSIVLAISVEDLRSQSAAGSRSLVLSIRDRLSELQKQIEMRIPIYLLITKCDLLTGFGPFVRHLPDAFLGQMFGWSNPHSLDLAFSSAWIDEALFSIGDRIDRLTFEMFATEENTANAAEIFLLRNEIDDMRSALSNIATHIFSENPYSQSPFLRGVYLSGDPVSLSSLANIETDEIGSTQASQSHPAFLDDLLARKVYAEKGVASPFQNALLSRNRLTLALQVATLVFVIAAAVGTSAGYLRLRATKDQQLMPILQQLQEQPGDLSNHRGNAAFNQIQAMAALDVQPFRSLFFPQSWDDSVDRSLGDVMVGSFANVFGGLRKALQVRHERILTEAKPTAADCSSSGTKETHLQQLPQYIRLNTFVAELAEWDQNVHSFDRMVTPGYDNVGDFWNLVFYLHPSFLRDSTSLRSNPYFQRALRLASDKPFTTLRAPANTRTAKELSSCFLDIWLGDSAVLDYKRDIEQQLEKLQASSTRFDDLGTLAQTIGAESALLQKPRLPVGRQRPFRRRRFPCFPESGPAIP